MVRKITVTALYEMPDIDEDKYFDIMVPPHHVESMIFNEVGDIFDAEGFCGLRVDCDDSFNMDEEELHRLEKFVGCDEKE